MGALLRRNALVAGAAAGLLLGLTLRTLGRPQAAEAAMVLALLVTGVPLVVRTARGLVAGKFAADVVAAMAIVGAGLLQEYLAGLVIVLMQSGGEALERHAMSRASRSLDALLARAPRVAHRLNHGEALTDIAVEDVRVGDTVLVRPGELVPIDAEVVDGTSTVDESALTGEAFPVAARRGTALKSGSLNLEGALTVRATRLSAQSQYQMVVRLVENARNDKPPIQRLADRWAVWFTPLTLIVAGGAWMVSADPTVALAVLVVATPCPLILAVPVAVIAGINRAANRGIIVKSGSAIEQAGSAEVVVFDKTGTLTTGHPDVAAVRGFDGASPEEILAAAASVEQFSSHHMGRAIVTEARRRGAVLQTPTDFEESPGAGVAGRVGTRMVLVGSTSFLEGRGVGPASVAGEPSTAFVAVDGRIAGTIQFADSMRRQVPALMQRLSLLGITERLLLTGDGDAEAEVIARAAGISRVHANLLPSDKLALVNQLTASHRGVVMVGDGINDAPALAAATVGIALGAHGTAAAADAADVVLLVDDVGRVAETIEISRRTRHIARQSAGIGLGVSFGLMLVAAAGGLTPTAGALLQEVLDVAVILNALRARL